MDRSFWAPVINRLPQDISIIAYDCRGHGESARSNAPPPEAGYAIETFGHDLAAVLDTVGWDAAVIAGASMGGCVTLAFAELYPDRVLGLGLFDTTACYGEDALPAWNARAGKARAEGLGALVDFQKTRWFTEDYAAREPEVVQACVDVFMRNDLACYAATCRMLGTADLRPGLDRLTMPAEIVVGEQDYATPPAMAEALAAALPDARLHIVPGTRHLTPVEAADEVAGTLVALLARAEGSAP